MWNRLPSVRALTVAGIVLLVAAGGVFGYWAASGAHGVTQYEVKETVVEVDEFGDEIERTQWRDEFRFGLFPDRGYDAAATLGGTPAVLGVLLLILAGIKSSRTKAQ